MIEPSVIVAVVALAGAIAAPVVAALLGRRKDQTVEGRLNHDELQEDLAALREEFRAEKEETRLYKKGMTAQINYQGRVIRHLDDEVIQLRQGVETGQIPPLPPRPPWPDEISV